MCWIIKKIFGLMLVCSLCFSVNEEPLTRQKKVDIDSTFYLIFPKEGLKKEIYSGLSWLDENKICSLSSVLEFSSTILLFGHNRTEVFHFLYDVEIGDMFILERHNHQEKYRVTEKKIISVSDKSYLEIDQNEELRMFTCTNNSETRLFIRALKTT